MMLNFDAWDRFEDQYLTLMIDSFSCTPMGANTLEFNQIYLQIFRIHVGHFDFDVIFVTF